MRIINLLLLSSVLWGLEQSLIAEKLENEQYRQKYNIQVTGNNAKEVIPSVPTRDPRIEDIPEKLAAIFTKLTALKSQLSSHDKSTQTEFDALCTLLNSIINSEDCLDKKIKVCCTSLNSQIDQLTNSVAGNFDTVIDVLNKIISQDASCCSELKTSLDNLSSLVESEFSTVIDKLNDIRAEETIIESKFDICCATLNDKIDNLTDIVEEDFGLVFETLSDIRAEETIIESKLDSCCTTLNGKIDNLTNIVENDFALVFESLNAIRDQETTIESKIDSCCATLNSKVDGLAVEEFTIESKIDSLSSSISSDFAGTFTVLSTQSLCSPIQITLPTTISTPGHYCLANDLSGVDPLILILGSTANDIVLDLNGHTLNVDSFGIVLDGASSHKNIQILNGSVIGGVFGISINTSSIPHRNIQLQNISMRNSTAVGFFAASVEELVIDQVVTFSCGSNLINACKNVLIKDSFFSNNMFDGCDLISSCDIQVLNSFFNNNGAVDSSIHRGLMLDNVVSFKAKDCSFDRSFSGGNQQYGVAIYAAVESSSHLTFEHCMFNNNLIDGIVTVTSAGGVPSNVVQCIIFDECQANANGSTGFHMTNNVFGVDFNSCVACANKEYGYLVDGTTPHDVCIQNSIAKENGIAGFEFASGTGLIQSNKAVRNGDCGFDGALPVTTSYSYVGNVAKNNGLNPADINLTGTDSNYCLHGGATAFVTPGPGALPYSQLALVPGLSRGNWDNITLP